VIDACSSSEAGSGEWQQCCYIRWGRTIIVALETQQNDLFLSNDEDRDPVNTFQVVPRVDECTSTFKFFIYIFVVLEIVSEKIAGNVRPALQPQKGAVQHLIG
jgi:hypothetical protein